MMPRGPGSGNFTSYAKTIDPNVVRSASLHKAARKRAVQIAFEGEGWPLGGDALSGKNSIE